MTHPKPVPIPTDEDREFWRRARSHEFVLPQCRSCGHVWFPAYMRCPSCLSRGVDWVVALGHGTVFAFTVFHRPYVRSFADDVPYNVVLVQLDEGPFVYGNVIEGDAAVDMRVEVVFDDVDEEIALPRFRPLSSPSP